MEPAIRSPLAAARPLANRRWALAWPRTEQWVAGGVLAVLLLLVVPPLVVLLRTSLVVGERLGRPGTLSLDAYAEILGSPSLAALVGGTLAFAFGSSLLGLVVGGLLAWCTERTNAPFK